jgi:Protein of Unknown function (DUF2784)
MHPVLADLIVILHLAFIAFVVTGGVLVLRWPRAAWVHLPAAAWGAAVEFFGWICPLTPLESRLRGNDTAGDFVAHYLLPLVYPAALTRELQWFLGAGVIAVNVAIYVIAFRRRTRRHRTPGP